MSQPSLSRRNFLLGAGAAALGGPALLAACGSSGGGAGSVSMANWTLYIEDDKAPKKSPTLSSFKTATGIGVNYQAVIDDNDSFTTKYGGKLAKGQAIGFDLVVLTSWMASRWIKNGWAQKLDKTNIPNFSNMLDRHLHPAIDPDRTYTMPYAEGQTGIAYYADKTGFDITSINDMLKPELKGKVTILKELRDCVGLFLLGQGIDPAKADSAAIKAAIDAIGKARAAGQFDKVTGNEYADLLGRKEIAAAVAWSGDVAALQKDNNDLKWVIPKDGGMSFIDTMLIPIGAKNKAGAEKLMNHFYDPKISGPLFEAINYVSPVKGAGDHMSAAAAKNPLINPGPDVKIAEFRDLSEAEAQDLEKAWAQATEG